MRNIFEYIDSDDTYLAHVLGAKKVGYRGLGHKYVAKVEDGDVIRYFYSVEEYERWKADRNRQMASAYGAHLRDVEAGKANMNTVTRKVKTPKHKAKYVKYKLRNSDGSLTEKGQQYFSSILQRGTNNDSFWRGINTQKTWKPKTTYGKGYNKILSK